MKIIDQFIDYTVLGADDAPCGADPELVGNQRDFRGISIEIIFQISSRAVADCDAASACVPDAHIIIPVELIPHELGQLQRAEAGGAQIVEYFREKPILLPDVEHSLLFLAAQHLEQRRFFVKHQGVERQAGNAELFDYGKILFQGLKGLAGIIVD